MKATELRIGNLAIDTTEGFAGRKNRTIEVSHEVIYSIACGNDYWKPIPLTEEWLERFNWNPPKGIGVAFSTNTHEIYFVAGNYYKTIEYVHQLQNLYFSLTGEELQTDETDQKVNQ